MLKRTLRRAGNALCITIPSVIIQLIDAKEGDKFQIDVDNNNTLILKKI